MTLNISRVQAKIVMRLLEFNIENLIDEPPESERGIECAESEKLFDALYDELMHGKVP
jgi:hypothetical protein